MGKSLHEDTAELSSYNFSVCRQVVTLRMILTFMLNIKTNS